VEAKKCHIFSGHILGRHEDAVASGFANASMLKDLGSNPVDGWLRQCYQFPGKGDNWNRSQSSWSYLGDR
jgi:hypothetical protein